jgi:hypothetical protein
MLSTLTVTTPATSSQLTTLATLKTQLALDDSQDAFLTSVIDVCSDQIALYLGRDPDENDFVSLGRETITETFYNASGVSELHLGRRPVSVVTSIDESGVTINSVVEGSANPAWPYVVRKQGGRIWKITGGSPSVFNGNPITVIYSAGWVLPDDADNRTLPRVIENACVLFCRRKIDQIQTGQDFSGPLTGATVDGVGSFQFNGESALAKGYGIPMEIRAMIDRYKDYNI